MNITDKERIKQYIERRIKICEQYSQLNLTESTMIGNHAQLLELREIKDFIDSLPEEPASKDLEEEIDRFAKTVVPSRSKTITRKNLFLCAHHFAEWQREKDIKLKKN